MANTRPIITVHLPVPMDFLLDVQRAFLHAYSELADKPAGEVMITADDGRTVTLVAPEET